MDAKKNNLMDSINTVFKLAIKVQEDYKMDPVKRTR